MISLLKSRTYFAVVAVSIAFGVLYYAAAATAQDTSGKESAAPTKQTVKETGKKGNAGNDQNIKSDSDKNNPDKKVEPTPQKSGKKSRGLGPYPCSLQIDNHSPWLVRIYVDGYYRGTVNSYGDLIGITGNGTTTTYWVAVFDNGTTTTWGPHVFNCGAGSSYSWGLY